MKLNKLNKFYIGMAIILVLASVFRFFEYKGWERYNYSASISAPETYPIHVRDTYFLTPNDAFVNIEEEDANNFTTTWGVDYGLTNHARSQRLPAKLVLNYFSYREHKFYRDTLNLPQKEILSIFKSAQRNKQELMLSQYAGPKKGLNFVIGIANNGNVIIWLRGVYLEKEILKMKLKPKEPTADDLYYEKTLTKEEYFKHAFEGLSDSLKIVYKNGFDAKANYIDTPSLYVEKNTELWEYQEKNGYIDFKLKDNSKK